MCKQAVANEGTSELTTATAAAFYSAFGPLLATAFLKACLCVFQQPARLVPLEQQRIYGLHRQLPSVVRAGRHLGAAPWGRAEEAADADAEEAAHAVIWDFEPARQALD